MTNTADDTRLMEDFGFSNLDDICIFDNFSTSGTLHDGDTVREALEDNRTALRDSPTNDGETVSDALDDDPTALRDSPNITEFHRRCSPGHLLTRDQ